MALDKRIADAVREAVKSEGQDTKAADRLIAWLEALTSGNETLGDIGAANRHLTDLFEIVAPGKGYIEE
jgi:hypothetical protein